MKIRYFSIFAEQAFVTAPSGERLFYCGLDGLWSRPYVIPDEATEKRLYQKQLWLMRVVLGTMILGQPFLYMALISMGRILVGFILYMGSVYLIFAIVNWLIFRHDLAKLKRVDRPVPFSALVAQTAKRRGWPMIYFSGGFSLVIAIVCLLWLAQDAADKEAMGYAGIDFLPWVGLVFSCLMIMLWGYIFYLKYTSHED